MIKEYIEKMSKEDKEMYNMRNYDNRTEYHGGEYRENYRDDGYRDEDYREDYRNDYRGDYRDNYRRNYDRRGGRINRRSYREDLPGHPRLCARNGPCGSQGGHRHQHRDRH